MKITKLSTTNWFYALAIVGVFLATAGPLSAQSASCNTTAVNPIISAESYAEITGDFIVTCTGGTPTTAGQLVPAVTFTLFTNAIITSKITDGGANNPAFNEALLIVDDPNTSFNNSTALQNILRHPILACGSGNANFDPLNPGVCDVIATGNPDTAYDGNNIIGAARPNVFQGRQVANSGNSAVQFIGVPFDAPGPGKIITFRITNVRVNGFQPSNGNVTNVPVVQISAFISIASAQGVTTATNLLTIATARNGAVQPSTGITGGSYPQCNAGQMSGGSLSITEGFAASFKPKNWAQYQANGQYTGGTAWVYSAGISPVLNSSDLNQNVPGVYQGFVTTSDITFPGIASIGDPLVNPPPGISGSPGTSVSASQNFAQTEFDTGLISVGQASNGTRFAFVFSNIPTGSGATVPTVVPLTNSRGAQTGVIVYVAGADANGAGGSPSLTGPTGGSVVPLSDPGPTVVTYEVIFSDFIQIETATVPITLNPSGTAQANLTAQGVAMFAPFYTSPSIPDPNTPESLPTGFPNGQDGGLPIPRFENNLPFLSTTGLWTFTPCTSDLTLSLTHAGNFTQGQSGATYSIVVSNSGNAATSGPVIVSDPLPSGLIATAMSGPGWTCTQPAGPCSRPDTLAKAASHPAITVTTNVAVDAAASIVNVATVSGGGETVTSNDSAADPATVLPLPTFPDLTISLAHTGNFNKGQVGATYTLTVTNSGNTATVGAVTVNETIPLGMTLISMSGTGWTCGVQPSCTRSDLLSVSGSYPALAITVNVNNNSAASVVNMASVSGGGETNTSNDSANDPTAVSENPPAEVGIFRAGYFWLQDVNNNQQFDLPSDRAFAFGGVPGDIPITGDWNGSGTTKVGVYRPSNGLFVLDYDGDGQFTAADKAYNLGVGIDPTDIPVVGDWNGDGKTKVGLFRKGFFWILDTNGDGVFEQGTDNTYAFGGVTGDVPIVGDWNGSGVSKIGLFRQGFFWILDTNGNGSIDNVNGLGGDQAFAFGGISGDVPVVGDWNGSGTSKVGVFRDGFFWVLDANGNHAFDGTDTGQDLAFAFGGITGDKPVIGKW